MIFKAFQEGRKAYSDFEPTESNPYKSRKDIRWLLWDLGWRYESDRYSYRRNT